MYVDETPLLLAAEAGEQEIGEFPGPLKLHGICPVGARDPGIPTTVAVKVIDEPKVFDSATPVRLIESGFALATGIVIGDEFFKL
jgi:hypothetical protein